MNGKRQRRLNSEHTQLTVHWSARGRAYLRIFPDLLLLLIQFCSSCARHVGGGWLCVSMTQWEYIFFVAVHCHAMNFVFYRVVHGKQTTKFAPLQFVWFRSAKHYRRRQTNDCGMYHDTVAASECNERKQQQTKFKSRRREWEWGKCDPKPTILPR